MQWFFFVRMYLLQVKENEVQKSHSLKRMNLGINLLGCWISSSSSSSSPSFGSRGRNTNTSSSSTAVKLCNTKICIHPKGF